MRKKPLITQMLANARATRRCLRYAQTCFAAALALLCELENNFGSSKAAAKQVATEGSDSDELRER